MQILNKTGRLDKSNVYADTNTSVKTYDLDKMVKQREAQSKIGVGGFTYNCFYCNSEHNNPHDYYTCETKCFMSKYPPNFLRVSHPELTTIIDDKVSWNYETLLLLHISNPMDFCTMTSFLESEIIAYEYGDLKVTELKLNRDNDTWDELVNNTLAKINLEISK